MEQFKVGDVVRLRSGGPPMTVVATGPTDKVQCLWFDGSTAKKEQIPTAALKPSREPNEQAADESDED